MTGKTVKELRRKLLEKYTGEALTGYEHLDDGTGDFARNVPDNFEEKSNGIIMLEELLKVGKIPEKVVLVNTNEKSKKT